MMAFVYWVCGMSSVLWLWLTVVAVIEGEALIAGIGGIAVGVYAVAAWCALEASP